MPAPDSTNGTTPVAPARRTMLKGLAAGAAGVGAFPLLAACTGASKKSTPGAGTGTTGAAGGGGSKSTSIGSGSSDPAPKAGLAAMVDAFKAKSGDTVTINTKAHEDFQNQIASYLQGSPDDTFTWFAGYRMKYYAKQGLVAPVDDVWQTLGPDNFGEGIRTASTADDGKKYFIPNYNYPWAIFYRKSLWKAKGYQIPATYDALKTLCAQMKKDGLTPIAFADKEGWPAMGTFDYLNMRLNGYQFHVDLMAHKETWDQQKVKDVFDNWKAILPYHQSGALGLIWQDAAQGIATKKSGMYLLGSFVTQQFTDKLIATDVDFFPFPTMTEANGQDAVEAPIDGYMLTNKGAKNQAAKDLLAFLGSPEGQDAYAKKDPAQVATNKQADQSSLSIIQKKSAQIIGAAKYISQFLDRDALPSFASGTVIPALQAFVKDGSFDTKKVEAGAKDAYANQ